MRKEDIEISLHDGALTISGERKEEGDATRTERPVGKFRRSISLPTRVDATKVNATYKDGILTVTLRKAEEEVQADPGQRCLSESLRPKTELRKEVTWTL